MNQSSILHRQEVSPVEFARSRVFANPDPLEGQCWLRKDSNVRRAAIDFGCNIVLPAEYSPADEIRKKPSPKKTIEIPKKRLLEEELSKVKETKHPSPPSLIARLMGLDAFPPRKKNMGSCCQITSSPSLLGNYADGENCSQWRNNEKQDFKDVFEVTEAPNSRKRTNHSDTMATHKQRVYEIDASIARKKFVDVKGQSSIELLHNSKEFDGAFEITYSDKDLSLEHIQDLKSSFAKHLQDLKHTPSSSRSSRIIVLKPYKDSTEHRRNEVQCRPCKTEKGNDRFCHEHREITGSYMPYATRLKKCHGEEDRSYLPYNPPPSRGRSETSVLPVPIVVLKPIRKKAEKMTEASFLKHDHLWFDSEKDRKIAASRTREFQHEERNVENLFHYHNGLNHKVDGSERIYRNITRKIRHNRNRLTEWKFTSQTGKYAGTKDSLVMPGNAKLIDSDLVPQHPDPYGDWVSSSTSSTINSTKSYVAMEPSHYSKRWNVTQQFHDSGYISQCSSTPNEDSDPFEEETTKYTLDFSKNISAKKLLRDEVLYDKICHLGIISKDACKYGSSRFSPSSKSIPDSGIPKLIDRKVGGGKTTILGNVPDVESPDSLHAKFCMLIPPVKKSEHQNHTYQFDDSVEDKDMLPECEIHVDSGLGKEVSKLNTAPTNHSMTETYCLNDSIYVPIPGDEAWKLITRDQELGSTFQVPSSHTHNHTENLSSYPGVKFIPSESNITESQLTSNDLEQPSLDSVSETLSENETYSSGCFERLSAELKELRLQLQHLKLESAGTCAEEGEVLMLSDEDCAGSNTILLPSEDSHEGFRDDDDRDFTYLLDILVESGIQNINDSNLLNACCSLDCPLDQSVFSKLEKKYDGIAATWSRLERKLLFDLISCCLADIVRSSMGVCPQLISSTCLPTCECSSLIEGLWQIVVEQKKGLQERSDNKVLEPGLFGWKHNIDLVVIEMEKILNADLLEELVGELQAAWVFVCSSYADHLPI